jgi:hypothetical protein
MNIMKDIEDGIAQRAIGELLVADEGLNVALGTGSVPGAGNPHFTVSQRLAEMRANGSKVGCIGCAILTWIQNRLGWPGDHCTDAMKGMPENIPTDG